MNRVKTFLQVSLSSETLHNTIRRYAPYLLILATMLLAYGWQLGRLGFYWDDWVYVYRYQTLGIFNTIFYGGPRQIGALALLPGFLFSADNPLRWHIYSLLLRFVLGGIMWWALGNLWPDHRTSVTLMVILFSVYPAFSQNSIAVVYSVHFFAYAAFLTSLGLMIVAERKPRRLWLFTILSLAFEALHLVILEYFFGLEFLRPIILFSQEKETRLSKRVGKLIWKWLPYLLILGMYQIWRLGLFGPGFVTYGTKSVLDNFRQEPVQAALDLTRLGVQDILTLLVTAWQTAITPGLIDWGQPYNLFSLLIVVATALGLTVVLSRLKFEAQDQPKDSYLQQAVVLGLAAVVLGFLPAWYVERHISTPGIFGDRYSLPSIFGASLLFIAAIDFFGNRRQNRQILLTSVLIGLAVGVQMRNTNNYRWEWTQQLRLYWQIYWRAPALKPGTVLVGNRSISKNTPLYTSAFAINELYDTFSTSSQPPIWYVNYYRTLLVANQNKFLSGDLNYEDHVSTYSFPVTPDNSLGVYNDPEQCLWVIVPGDLTNEELPDDFRLVVNFSRPDLILPRGSELPPAYIFGPEPVPTWCTYFQKAELARQQGEWGQIVKYRKEANQSGLESSNALENLPFIEAYGRLGDWNAALTLSLRTFERLPRSRVELCSLWDLLSAGGTNLSAYQAARSTLNAQLSCPSN
jgi:hypothetical protein